MFRMIGFGENIGSGFPKIVAAWKKSGWDMPLLEEKPELEEVRLTLFLNNEAGQKSGQKTSERILELIRQNPDISRTGLSELTGKASSTIQKHLENLKASNKIKRIGPDKGGHWEVLDDPMP